MAFEIERDWTTSAGLRAIVVIGGLGFRCGYVGIPPGHPLHGVDYAQDHESIDGPPYAVFDVHGGITFANNGIYSVECDLWWFGFDCGHLGDSPSPEYIARQSEKFPHDPALRGDYGGIHRSLGYCVAECEKLANQLAAVMA